MAEFALIAPVFLLTMSFIFEIGLALFTQENMDNAARYAARLIRIGTITGSSYSSTLVSDICGTIVLVPSCSANIRVYVAAAASGSTAGSGYSSISTATVTAGNITSSYATLAANDDVIVELGYSQPWVIGLVARAVGGTNALLLATVAVQTEPY
ncbi:MAG TPA: TadE/TadG family type IV pilus assembly protein [Candidatus Udaeobacter sp.]|nr:TadE/TadG family type IV pilus assembly protein [Candidatus Udaeobacter sp.]